MNPNFANLDALRRELVKNATAHAWGACVPLIPKLEKILADLPAPENDDERAVLVQFQADFKEMTESATAEHADIFKLLQGFSKNPR